MRTVTQRSSRGEKEDNGSVMRDLLINMTIEEAICHKQLMAEQQFKLALGELSLVNPAYPNWKCKILALLFKPGIHWKSLCGPSRGSG